jgi:anaerobic ribonucleoside-triphosphate reductase activating protein
MLKVMENNNLYLPKQSAKIRIAGLVKNSIVDGPGIRYVVFGQGCPLKCKDCHNPHTHDFFGGELRGIADIATEIHRDPLLDGVTFTGGEPFAQAEAFAQLAELIPNHHIICYSGYTFEELYAQPQMHILLRKIDVLVDGRFENSLKQYNVRFKGSTNQRAIDIKESFINGTATEIVL